MSNYDYYSDEDQAYLRRHDIRFSEVDFFNELKIDQKNNQIKPITKVKLARFITDDRFDESLQKCLADLNFKQMKPIQAVTIPEICNGCDVIAISETSSGKTIAFTVPMIIRYRNFTRPSSTHSQMKVKPRVLILTPTRELAIQVNQTICSISSSLVTSICVYGGVDRNKQISNLKTTNPVIIVATPGRLKDFLENQIISLDEIEIFVLDEADRMLDKGFFSDVEFILKYVPKKRQILLFSATWNDELNTIFKGYLNIGNLFKVSIGSINIDINTDILQIPIVMGEFQKVYFLSQLIGKIYCGFKILVFFNRTDTVSRMVKHFQGEKIAPAYAFTSEVTQDKREYLIQQFRNGHIRILFASDAVARGLDIDNIHVVINYDFPATLDTYIHRIGRTGRNGKYGQAISFISPDFRSKRHFHHFKNILERGNSYISKEFNELGDSSDSD